MILSVRPGSVKGQIVAPPSKSHSHRAILLATLADGPVTIERPLLSGDPLASVRAIKAWGCQVERTAEGLTIIPRFAAFGDVAIDCGNSGTTLRLATGLAAARPGVTRLDGDASLRTRPMAPLLSALGQAGVEVIATDDRAPLVIHGPLAERDLTIPGEMSSQYVSALLLALTASSGGTLTVTGPQVSAPYVGMTIAALGIGGVRVSSVHRDGDTVHTIPAGAVVRGGTWSVAGDWSSAAFGLCAGALAGAVTITGLPDPQDQADGAIVGILDRMGAEVTTTTGGQVTVKRGELRGLEVDLAACPDLFPILAVTLAYASGKSVLHGAPHLRAKETDRIAAMAQGLHGLGIDCRERPDGLELAGDQRLAAGSVDSHHDHRILMAFAVGALRAQGPISITDPDPAMTVAISYPDFLSDLAAIGVDLTIGATSTPDDPSPTTLENQP